MRYVNARYENNQRDLAYRFYVTDALKIIGGLNVHYSDFFKPEEKRSADEIINKIKDGLNKI